MRTITNRDLRQELLFIPDEAKVFCRDLGYGYQLVLKWGKSEDRIFVGKVREDEPKKSSHKSN